MDNNTMKGLPHVEATLNYLAEGTERPVSYAYTSPSDTPPTTRRNSPHPVTIRNARPILSQLSLDQHGFVLTHQDSTVTNFYDEQEVREVYYPEVERLLKEVTGAVKVVIFDHVVRCAPKARQGEPGVREPARIVHNDYSFKSAPRRVRDHLPAEAEELLKHRFAEINVWRAIRGPIQESPLALCDARSIAPQDVVASDLVYPDRVGEVYRFTYNPAHCWYYFPHLEPSEVVLLKCYDSQDDGRARFTAHTAFEDPTSPPEAAPRESIEVRALVFFAPETKKDAEPGTATASGTPARAAT